MSPLQASAHLFVATPHLFSVKIRVLIRMLQSSPQGVAAFAMEIISDSIYVSLLDLWPSD